MTVDLMTLSKEDYEKIQVVGNDFITAFKEYMKFKTAADKARNSFPQKPTITGYCEIEEFRQKYEAADAARKTADEAREMWYATVLRLRKELVPQMPVEIWFRFPTRGTALCAGREYLHIEFVDTDGYTKNMLV